MGFFPRPLLFSLVQGAVLDFADFSGADLTDLSAGATAEGTRRGGGGEGMAAPPPPFVRCRLE